MLACATKGRLQVVLSLEANKLIMRAGQCDRECRPDLAAYNATKLLERFGTKFHSGLIQ